MTTELRSISSAEETAALKLWCSVMSPREDYFARYFSVDPWYQVGDCFGAWVDGELASAVHICRRHVRWQDRTLLMGGIANVATLPHYRDRGLSRGLLRLAIARMEESGIDFSALGTGIPGHYAPLGWEIVEYPVATVTIPEEAWADPHDSPNWSAPEVSASIEKLYSAAARPLQMLRSAAYFSGWTGWVWTKQQVRQWAAADLGYIAMKQPESDADPLNILEIRAVSADAEKELLSGLIAWAREAGFKSISLNCMPQWNGSLPHEADNPAISHRRGKMLRNISLPADTYAEIAKTYSSGQACWWPGDGF